jgi:hypothetical protein
MEAGPGQLPLKVCRHCSVASRTEDDACPSCGRSYTGRGWGWRWWYAIPIVAAAFAIGYFGISELVYDDPAKVNEEEAQAIELGTARDDVEQQLGEPNEVTEDGGLSCSAYEVDGQDDADWLFCYRQERLVTSQSVSG